MSDPERPQGPHTRAVPAGETPDATGSLVPPIHQTTVFRFRDPAHMADVLTGAVPGHVYSRLGNPTVRAAELKLAALEEAEDALVFGSGMAAILSGVLAVVSAGDHVVAARDIYGQTFEAFR